MCIIFVTATFEEKTNHFLCVFFCVLLAATGSNVCSAASSAIYRLPVWEFSTSAF